MAADRTKSSADRAESAVGSSIESTPTVPPGFEAYVTEEAGGVAAGAPGKDGLLEAEFTRYGDRTRLTHQYTRVPYHLGRQLDYDDPFAAIRVQSPTAGIGQGDRLRLELSAGPNARVHVSSASSTKVFGMDHGFGQSRIDVHAATDAYVELFPEPTILHARSRLHQPVELSADADGVVVYADVVVPGRLARGEIFEFDRYANVVEGVDPDGLAFRDAVDLVGEDSFSGPGVFGHHSVLGTLYVLAPDADAEMLSDTLHERVQTALVAASSEQATDEADRERSTQSTVDRSAERGAARPHVEASASILPRSGVVVRALGPTAPPVTETLSAARDSVRKELVGQPAPDPRRW